MSQGFEPRCHILEECKRWRSYYIIKKTKNKNKGSQRGHTKKILIEKFELKRFMYHVFTITPTNN
jgi:hypothetical protein